MKDYDMYSRLMDEGDGYGDCSFPDNGSETLVIHPEDHSTLFLSAIYENKGWDVMTDPFVNDDTVTELIKSHSRIICLGTETPMDYFVQTGSL